MPGLRLSDKLMFSTVKISCTLSGGRMSTGTGFYYSSEHVQTIVTNRHVVENSLKGRLSMTRGEENEPILGPGIQIEIDKFSEKWNWHPDSKVDLAMMPLRLVVRECRKQGKLPFYTKIQADTIADVSQWREFIPIEDILMIGYPNGLWDESNNLPFFMKGISATHPGINYKGKNEFVINTPVYLGSSGSPILLLNKEFYDKSRTFQGGRDAVRLLGIAYKHCLYHADGKVKTGSDLKENKTPSRIILDLGIAIRSTRLRDFESIFEQNRSEWEM